MTLCKGLTGILLGLAATTVAAEVVGVSGSNTQFTTPIEARVGGEQVKFVLTGTALRTKLLFNVYAIGSYVQDGVSVRTAEELAAGDWPKRLHLVMERDVAGKDIAEAFRSAIRQNYPAPQFASEINAMHAFVQTHQVRKGEHIWLTHIPRVGLQIDMVGKTNSLVPNPAFSKAIWDIYLGKNNLGEGIKRSLTSRL